MENRISTAQVIAQTGASFATIGRRVAAGELHPVRNPLCRRENLFDPAEVADVFGLPDTAA
ncbi:hypothetical protein [Corynebacterium nuruki]|uniref:hypothetical protein n=1 Tax=Corynebacterium nuruki TaxID=1032851 RepID=UPI0039BF2BA4